MVLTEQTLTAEVLFHNKKKYKRVFLKHGVEWRRFKTNHQITKEEQYVLEEMYNTYFRPHFVPSSFIKPLKSINKHGVVVEIESRHHNGAPILKNKYQQTDLHRGAIEVAEGGKFKLKACKYVKDNTGWELRDCKLFVDNLWLSMKTTGRW
jgi:hypothetical protein